MITGKGEGPIALNTKAFYKSYKLQLVLLTCLLFMDFWWLLWCFGTCRLFVVRGSPEEVFPKLFKTWDVKKITWELDTEPYARTRDERVEKLARECGVEVVCRVGHTLYRVEK